MSKLTKDEARIAATHLAYLAWGMRKWLEGCTAEEQQRRLDFVITMLTPDETPSKVSPTFDHWYEQFFAGNGQIIPEHVRSSYRAAYEAGYTAGAAS